MKRKQNQKGKISEFSIANNILQLPDGTDKERIVTKKGAKVISAGDDNLLPFFITKVANESSTLRAIITSFSDFVSYGELVANGFDEQINPKYDVYEFLKRVSKDRKTLGYAFFICKIVAGEKYVYHTDASKCRYEEYDGDEPQAIWYSEDWNDVNKDKNHPVRYSLVDYDSHDNGKKIKAFEIKNYTPSQKDYATPDWSGAFYDAQVESLIAQYNANQFENGVTLSSILMFDFGQINGENDLRIAKQKLENQLKGTSKGRSGKSLIVPKEGEISKPEYTVYPMQKEGSFTELQKMTENNIVKACSWYRSLAGLESAGSLGNNQQLKNEWAMAERLVMNEQYLIFNELLKALELELEFDFNNESPLTLTSEIDINDILNENEKRALFGFEESEQKAQRTALNGAQVTSMVDVVKSFTLGEISKNAAVQTLVIGYNLTEEEAERFLK